MKRVTEIDWKLVQRINIWFCVKVGLTCPQTTHHLQAVHGANVLSGRRIRHWHREFTNGHGTLVDLQRRPKDRSGRSAANIQTIKGLIDANKRITVEGLEAVSGIPHSTVHQIICKDLKL